MSVTRAIRILREFRFKTLIKTAVSNNTRDIQKVRSSRLLKKAKKTHFQQIIAV